MSTERQPLLAHPPEPSTTEPPGTALRSPIAPRPDVRNSPDTALVDVHSEDDCKFPENFQ